MCVTAANLIAKVKRAQTVTYDSISGPDLIDPGRTVTLYFKEEGEYCYGHADNDAVTCFFPPTFYNKVLLYLMFGKAIRIKGTGELPFLDPVSWEPAT